MTLFPLSFLLPTYFVQSGGRGGCWDGESEVQVALLYSEAFSSPDRYEFRWREVWLAEAGRESQLGDNQGG